MFSSKNKKIIDTFRLKKGKKKKKKKKKKPPYQELWKDIAINHDWVENITFFYILSFYNGF